MAARRSVQLSRGVPYGGPVPGRYGDAEAPGAEEPQQSQPSGQGCSSSAGASWTVGTAAPIGAPPSSSSSQPTSPSGHHHFENPFGTNGIFARVGEYIPFVNGGIQRLHELNGDEQALSRAKTRNPVGPDGFLTQAAEHIPVVNSVVQEAHRAAGESQALDRARDRNPIGTNGFVTKVVEHIPLFSDGVRALHQYQGDEMAAERARTHSLQKLLSKDGAITRLAELLPVSNLFAAAVHELNGNRDEAIRALDLIDSWAQALTADGLFTKVAELLPGADAVAFAIHVQGGYYAQAIRSITKVAWVNVEISQVTLYLSCIDLSHIHAKDLDAVSVEIIPRQLSLLVGMSDMLTNFLRIDREGHRRTFRTVVEMEHFSATGNTMELTKELLKAIIDEKIARRVEYFTSEVPNYTDWLVDVLNRWVPVWRRRRLLVRLLSPRALARMPMALKEEVRKAVPAVAAAAGALPPVEPIRQRKTRRGRRLTEAAVASSGCIAATGCLGLGAKAAGLACAAGVLAGAVELGRAAARLALSWMDEWNAECWSNVTRKPQPEPPDWQQEAERAEQDRACPSSSSRAASPSPPASHGRAASPGCPSSPSSSRASDHGESGAGPRGLVLEVAAADTVRLAALVRRYYFEDVLRGGLRGFLLRLVEPAVRVFVRSVVEAEGAAAPVVFEVELDEWETELEGYSWNLRLPSMRLALVLHLSFQSGAPRCTRAFVALPEDLLQSLARCLRAQMLNWDLRELDPRFAGFTQPVHTAFSMDAQWTSNHMLRLDALGVKSRLDLPN